MGKRSRYRFAAGQHAVTTRLVHGYHEPGCAAALGLPSGTRVAIVKAGANAGLLRYRVRPCTSKAGFHLPDWSAPLYWVDEDALDLPLLGDG